MPSKSNDSSLGVLGGCEAGLQGAPQSRRPFGWEQSSQLAGAAVCWGPLSTCSYSTSLMTRVCGACAGIIGVSLFAPLLRWPSPAPYAICKSAGAFSCLQPSQLPSRWTWTGTAGQMLALADLGSIPGIPWGATCTARARKRLPTGFQSRAGRPRAMVSQGLRDSVPLRDRVQLADGAKDRTLFLHRELGRKSGGGALPWPSGTPLTALHG